MEPRQTFLPRQEGEQAVIKALTASRMDF